LTTHRPSRFVAALLVVLIAGFAAARDAFALYPFSAAEFRDADKLRTACAAPNAVSFWCADLDRPLIRIPTKGLDLMFSEAGTVVAAFAKFQRGQNLTNYQVENRDNLVPPERFIPAGAILLDGEYYPPTDVVGSWTELPGAFRGDFSYRVDGLAVRVAVLVSNSEQTITYDVTVGVPEGADRELPRSVQFAVGGVRRNEAPTIKIGSSGTFALNPPSAPYARATYLSLQTSNSHRSSDNAIVMTPGAGLGGEALRAPLAAVSLGNQVAGMQVDFVDGVRFGVDLFFGKDELVRLHQEGYADLPGLFRPNILGRMSLWVLTALEFIHDYVDSWALSIIVLTLLFRALVWPLITTQTRSMFGMQRLQPELQKIQKKYKDDREKLTQETMKLYKEAGVNPAGGCLPILLQMPLFIILWRVFVNFEFSEGFLWIPDLGLPDPFYILPALYVLVMLAMSWFSARGNPTMLRQSMLINVVFVFIMVGFPAGVLLYFVVSMGVQVFQYWLLSRGQPAPQAAAKA
jgi:YidC/Oxa1 family membrane protein insertase